MTSVHEICVLALISLPISEGKGFPGGFLSFLFLFFSFSFLSLPFSCFQLSYIFKGLAKSDPMEKMRGKTFNGLSYITLAPLTLLSILQLLEINLLGRVT